MNRRDFLKAIPLLGMLPFLKTPLAKITVTDSAGNQSVKFVPIHDRVGRFIACEMGTIATPFILSDFGKELVRCQKYYLEHLNR